MNDHCIVDGAEALVGGGLGFLVHIKPPNAIENPERMLLGM